MSKITNVFVSEDNQINFIGRGKLANINDLNENICEGNDPTKGFIQLEDGIYYWVSVEEQMKILSNDTEIDEKELKEMENLFESRYVKVFGKTSKLYNLFREELEDDLEEVISCTWDAEDNELRAVTLSRFNNTVYVYNYCMINDQIEKQRIITHRSMFEGLFVA